MSIFGGVPKMNIAAEQEAAAAREREKLAREQEQARLSANAKATKSAAQAESRRKAFAGQLAEAEGDDVTKRRYLQAV